jgi:hypothetical protein
LSAWKKRLSIKGSHSKKSTKTDSGGQLSFARITVSHPYRANDRSKLNSDVVGVLFPTGIAIEFSDDIQLDSLSRLDELL